MNPTNLLRFSRLSLSPLSTPLALAASLSNRLPQHLSQPRLRAPLTNDATDQPLSSIDSSPAAPEILGPHSISWANVSLSGRTPKMKPRIGTVIGAGKMDKVVRVQYIIQVMDNHLGKPFDKKMVVRVADPRNSLREGDLIKFIPGYRTSKNVHHVVDRIVAPFGEDISQRPPLMTPLERAQSRIPKRNKGKTELKIGKVKARVLKRLLAEGLASDKELKSGEFKGPLTVEAQQFHAHFEELYARRSRPKPGEL
ncbi:hypothetical protein LOZ53_000924 [Ophidiomyces ophidiicola]|nr:hypothetical protein LOZ53_000924 [Ophidiomyces ophidiicola]